MKDSSHEIGDSELDGTDTASVLIAAGFIPIGYINEKFACNWPTDTQELTQGFIPIFTPSSQTRSFDLVGPSTVCPKEI